MSNLLKNLKNLNKNPQESEPVYGFLFVNVAARRFCSQTSIRLTSYDRKVSNDRGAIF